jgi:hypothetical protein
MAVLPRRDCAVLAVVLDTGSLRAGASSIAAQRHPHRPPS